MRIRTAFSNRIDLSGWWIKSKKGVIARLTKDGKDIRENILYRLKYNNGQIGNGTFTIESLIENGTRIVSNKKSFDKKSKNEISFRY